MQGHCFLFQHGWSIAGLDFIFVFLHCLLCLLGGRCRLWGDEMCSQRDCKVKPSLPRACNLHPPSPQSAGTVVCECTYMESEAVVSWLWGHCCYKFQTQVPEHWITGEFQWEWLSNLDKMKGFCHHWGMVEMSLARKSPLRFNLRKNPIWEMSP